MIWTEDEQDTIEAYVETLLERVAEGVDDVETAKIDLLSLLTPRDEENARHALFGATRLLTMWRTAGAQGS